MKRIFRNERSGGIRTGWLIVLAAGLYLLSDGAVYELYWYLYRMMMNIWGVNGENILRAPGWVQFLYRWSNVIGGIVQSAAILGAAIWLKRIGRAEKTEIHADATVKGALAGAALTFGIWAILMLTGSVRLGWRLSNPHLSVNTFAFLLMTAASAAAEGAFVYGALYGSLKKRVPVWAALGVVMIWNVLFSLLDGMMQPLILMNCAMAAMVLCGLTERSSAASAAGFLFVRNYLELAVFGFAGASAALYETYPVNLYWLNGGNSGIGNGVVTTVALAGLAAWLYRENIKRIFRRII